MIRILWGYFCAIFVATSTVPSVGPPSQRMISSGSLDWNRMLSSCVSTKAAPLNVHIATETLNRPRSRARLHVTGCQNIVYGKIGGDSLAQPVGRKVQC